LAFSNLLLNAGREPPATKWRNLTEEEIIVEIVNAPAMPRLNEPAPAFEAPTTHGVKKLEDYRGI